MIFFVLFITVTPFVLGHCIHKFIDKKKKGSIYQYLLGVFSFLCFFQAFHMAAIYLGWNFSQLVTYFSFAYLMLLLFFLCCSYSDILAFCRNAVIWKKSFQGIALQKFLWVFVVILFLVQCAYLYRQEPYLKEDISKEIILTTLSTDSIYQIHPLTGKTLEVGITPVGKLNSLPILYSLFIRLFHLDTNQLLYVLVPIWMLFLSYLVSYLFSNLLLEDHKIVRFGLDKHVYQPLFLLFFGLLALGQSGSVHSVFFRLFHEGWAGTTWITMIMLPFFLYCLMDRKPLSCLLIMGASIAVSNPGEGIWLVLICLFLYGMALLVQKITEVISCRK